MRVLALTHGRLVGPALFGDVIRSAGHELVEWDVPARGAPPADDHDAVVVLGGRMNIGEELEHPWLRDEYELLRRWVDGGTPVLGICLGAQALAHAGGARVARLPEQQRGFLDVTVTAAGERDAVVGALPRCFRALFGNSFGFELPPGGVELVSGNGRPQAFRLGGRAWGLQFHPEVRRDQVLAWWRAETDLPRPLDELTAELDAALESWQELGRNLCRAFLRAATDAQAPKSAAL